MHYDVSAWNLEQRAELSAALADEDIAHVWSDDELVVPEELEARTDALFARLDEELGPFPIVLAEDEPAVEYGLDEWPDDDRTTLTAALVESGIAHRWEGTTIYRRRRRRAGGRRVARRHRGRHASSPEPPLPPPEDALAAVVRRGRPAWPRTPTIGSAGRTWPCSPDVVRSGPSSVRSGQERLARRGRGGRSTRRGRATPPSPRRPT